MPQNKQQPTKRRTYNPRLVRQHHSYTAQEVADRFGLHKNAVLNWVKQGLRTIDGKRPLLIHGSDLIAFLDRRQKQRKRPCKPDEFYCCKCRQPQPVWERVLDLTQLKPAQWLARGLCAMCGTRMQRIYRGQNLPEMQSRFVVQTVNGEHISQSFNPLVMRDLTQGD